MKSSNTLKVSLLFLFSFFLMSCATGTPATKAPPPGAASKAVEPSIIQNISFVGEDNYTKIQIEGSEPFEPPFYKLLSDPLRIAIDVPNIDLRQIKEPLKINDGTVTEVLTTQLDDKGRIEIGLAQMTNYNIFKEKKNLIVEIEKVKKAAEVQADVDKGEKTAEEKTTEEKAIKEKEAEIPVESKTVEPPPIPPAKPVPPPETVRKVKRIVNYVFDKKKDSVTLDIIADGKFGDYDAFKLDSPPRLVLDIWGVDTRYPKKSIPVETPLIKRVRIGQHPDKLRLVFETPGTPIPPYQINPINEKLVVSFGRVPLPSEPQILLPEKLTGKGPALKNQLKAPIDFKQMDNKSRIVVSLTEEPTFESHRVSKNTIAVDIKNASVPKPFQRGLNTSEFDSEVKYIDIKNVKKGKENDIRILITLREEVPFETTKEGKTLLIDVEKPKKVGAVPEAKKEEVKKVETKEEGRAEEVKPLPEVKKPEKPLPPAEERGGVPPEVAKKAEGEKRVTREEGAEKRFTGSRLSLDFKDADIKNILRLIAEVSNLNIITGDDVTGKITMRLVDVPWDQALDIILKTRGLGKVQVGNVIRIAPLENLRKEYMADLDAQKGIEEKEALVTELIPVNYAMAKEISPQVKAVIGKGGNVNVDDRTNTLIVKDIPQNIVEVKKLVKSLDTKTPQVLIEARILEASVSFQRDLGISWGFMAGNNTTNKAVSTVGGGTAGTSNLRGTDVNTRKLVDLPSATKVGIVEFLFTSEQGLKNLDVAISASENKGDAKIISSPKIATLDNKEASIEQGLRIPYRKLTTEGTVTTDFIDANLKLTVTPHVTNDGNIKMSIRAKKDAPDTSITVDGVPSIDKKEAITEVMIKDGGVVVIAGVYTNQKSDTTDGVPLFNKIPLLGWLFKKESKQDTRKDLLIFISPKIFKDGV